MKEIALSRRHLYPAALKLGPVLENARIHIITAGCEITPDK